MKKLEYKVVGDDLELNGYIVMALDPKRIEVSLLWLKEAGFKGRFTVNEDSFGGNDVAYTTQIK